MRLQKNLNVAKHNVLEHDAVGGKTVRSVLKCWRSSGATASPAVCFSSRFARSTRSKHYGRPLVLWNSLHPMKRCATLLMALHCSFTSILCLPWQLIVLSTGG